MVVDRTVICSGAESDGQIGSKYIGLEAVQEATYRAYRTAKKS